MWCYLAVSVCDIPGGTAFTRGEPGPSCEPKLPQGALPEHPCTRHLSQGSWPAAERGAPASTWLNQFILCLWNPSAQWQERRERGNLIEMYAGRNNFYTMENKRVVQCKVTQGCTEKYIYIRKWFHLVFRIENINKGAVLFCKTDTDYAVCTYNCVSQELQTGVYHLQKLKPKRNKRQSNGRMSSKNNI